MNAPQGADVSRSGLASIADFPQGVPSDSRFLDGHFPGNPIVPGAILLGMAADALATQGRELQGVRRVKFLRPLPPETPFEILAGGSVIEWRSSGYLIAKAQVRIGADHR